MTWWGKHILQKPSTLLCNMHCPCTSTDGCFASALLCWTYGDEHRCSGWDHTECRGMMAEGGGRERLIKVEKSVSTVGVGSGIRPPFPKVELECFTVGVEVYKRELKLQSSGSHSRSKPSRLPPFSPTYSAWPITAQLLTTSESSSWIGS